MKTTVDFSDFREAFRNHGRDDSYTREGLEMLFNHFEELESDTGTEMELDVIAICCDYDENHWEDVASNYLIDLSDCEDDDDKIKASTIEVVAAAGVADASMTRIARNLQVSTGSVYPRFKNVSDVIGEAFSWSIQKIVKDNTQAYFSTSANADSYASVIVGSLSESRRTWRNFRLEMYLASRFHESLSKTMIPGLEQSDAVLESFVRNNGIPERHVTQIVGLMHALGIGFAVLQNAGIDVPAIDHRVPTRYLVSVLSILKSSGVAASQFKHSIAQDAVMSAMGGRRTVASAAS